MNADPLDSATLDVAKAVLDHLDELQDLPASARLSLRDAIRGGVRQAILDDRDRRSEGAEAARPLPLTRKQQEALDFIKTYIAREGVAPTYAEIAAGVGLAGQSGAHRLLVCLRDRGRIRFTPRLARTIEVLE